MVPGGYEISRFGLYTHIVAIVRGPSLPINIVITTMFLLSGERAGVMPVESPTVPNADAASNTASPKLISGSITQSSNETNKTSINAKVAMKKAFSMVSLGMRFLNAAGCLLVDVASSDFKITKAVVVFIPPPVEPGEAPTIISRIVMISPAFVRSDIG